MLQQRDRLTIFELMIGRRKDLIVRYFSITYPLKAMTCHSFPQATANIPASSLTLTHTHHPLHTYTQHHTQLCIPVENSLLIPLGFSLLFFEFLGYCVFLYDFPRINFSSRELAIYANLPFSEAFVVIIPLKLFSSLFSP